MSGCPLVIVGAGPAGMAAAVTAAAAGVRPVLLDENPEVGGQIYRRPPAQTGEPARPLTAASPRGRALLQEFERLRDRMDVRTGAAVWGVFPPRRLAVGGPDGWELLDAEHVIFATGAHEYVPPFPGWTLPGVLTPGAAQLMVKSQGVLPGRRVLVAGTGPFLLVVAEQLQRAGAGVVAVAEMAPTSAAVRALPGLLARPGLLRDGLAYLYRLRRAGVPVWRGHVVTEARGDGAVREAVVAPCDAAGNPDRARTRAVAADALCVGYGFVPRTQLPQLAGCEMEYVEAAGGWVPWVDEDVHTSVPGVWVAGDGGGVGGALAAEVQGRLAGLAVACRLGAIHRGTWRVRRRPLVREFRRLRRFAAGLHRAYPLRPGLAKLATPETVVCRCEEVTRAEVETAVAAGAIDLRTLKVMTRLGMGPCQGRMCWPAAARLVAAGTGRSVEAVGPASVRPPVRPVTVGDLAAADPAVPAPGR